METAEYFDKNCMYKAIVTPKMVNILKFFISTFPLDCSHHQDYDYNLVQM